MFYKKTICSMAFMLCAQGAFADGINNPDIVKLMDDTHCLIAKQIHRQSGSVLAVNRVCGKMFDVQDLFSPAQMKRMAPTDAFGTSNISKATVRFITKESQYYDADERWVRVSLHETGAFGERAALSVVKHLVNGEPVRIPTPSTVDIELISDLSHQPNSFEQRLYSRMGAHNSSYQYGYSSAGLNPWNPAAWKGMDRRQRESNIYGEHPLAHQFAPR